jgi:predicted nucleic acid-binding protein
MKVVIDNNVIIDFFGAEVEFKLLADEIFSLIKLYKIKPYVCLNSLTDIYYVLRKTKGSNDAKKVISDLLTVTSVIPLNVYDCKVALALPMNDFEDAIIAVSAKKVGADYVISRDAKFIKAASDVKVITPKELISIIRH